MTATAARHSRPTAQAFRANSDDNRHGSLNGYCNLGCRCQPCRDSWTAYCLRRRQERSLLADDPRHGSESTYFNYACRCSECRAAHASAQSARRAT